MDPSQVDDLDTRLRTCSIGSPTFPAPSTPPPPASTHALHQRVVSAPPALITHNAQFPSQPEDDSNDNNNNVGDISKILTQLYVLQHVESSESLYAELLRQAWAAYRARGLPPAQFRTLVDAECGPQRRNLAELMREIEAKSGGLQPLLGGGTGLLAEVEDMVREYEERSGVLGQREEMLLSVLPEGEREGPKWEPTPDQFREGMPTQEDWVRLMRSLEEREEERLRRRAVYAESPYRGYQ